MPIPRSFFAAVVVVILLAIPVGSYAQSSSPDEDGCFATADNCVTGRTEWGTGMNSDRYYLRLTNNCSARVYVRACMRMANGSPRCGAFGINPGETHNFNWNNAHESGDVTWTWIGSVRGSSDWVCAGKVPGWSENPDF